MLDERPNFFPGLEVGNIHQGASQTPNPIMFGRPRCDFDPPSPSQPMSAYNKDYLEISPPPQLILGFLRFRRFVIYGIGMLRAEINDERVPVNEDMVPRSRFYSSFPLEDKMTRNWRQVAP